MKKYSNFTVMFSEGNGIDKMFLDSKNERWDCEVIDGHLFVKQILRLIPDRSDGWKQPRIHNVYAPGVWQEVEVDYV
jgi:hypothetical protein